MRKAQMRREAFSGWKLKRWTKYELH
ncbi:hypothetical protein Gorai_018683 [Gossypium raimondii]|uniref:Uncharacterized protein n=1 Tax=Gossypium raimondii TaxID=29730 RepID=A0A7J8PKY8_GOSRA|nr:hypothetical protein [Gossypium raimondii]